MLKKVKKTVKYIFLSGLLTVLLTITVCANSITVQGYGTTRDEAEYDALRRAVEQAVGVMISSETMTLNYEVLKDEIYANSRGFVHNHEVIAEEKRNGQFILTVRAVVDTAPGSDLDYIIKQVLGNPRIAVIIPEYHVSARVPDPAGETAVIKKLIEAGFTKVTDVKQVQNIRYSDAQKGIFQGNKQQINSVSKELGVDYIITGEAFSQFAGNLLNSGVISCRARLEAKLIKADTAEIVAANSFNASGVDITELIAGKNALNKTGEQMGDFMVKKLLEYSSTRQEINLIVRNIPGFNKTKVLEEQLRKVPGVRSVRLRDYVSGVANVDLEYSGTARILAGALERIGEVTLVVEETSRNVIRATMRN